MTGTDRAASTAQRAEQRARAATALRMRTEGASFATIADELGYATPNSACKSVQSLLRRVEHEAADEARALEGARLDALHNAVWPAALAGDLPSVDRVLKISERRSKLLGLDAPQRVDLGASDVDLDGAVSALLELVAPGGELAALTGGDDDSEDKQ